MSWNEKNVRVNLWLFRASTLLLSFDLTRGLFAVFLTSRGVDQTQVGLLQLVFFWTIAVMNLPTGLFADYIGRKYAVALGAGAVALTFAAFPMAEGFKSYLIVFFLWGISYAFRSGAGSALLYDGLKSAGPQWLKTHVHELGRLGALSTVSTAIVMGLGGWFYAQSPSSVFYISGVCAVAAMAAILLVPEQPPSQRRDIRYVREISSNLKTFAKSTQGKDQLILVSGLAMLEAAHTPIFIYSQTLLTRAGFSAYELSTTLAVSFLCSALGMYLSPKCKAHGRQIGWLVAYTALAMVALLVLLAYVDNIPLIVVAIIVFNTIPNMMFVHTDNYLQDCTPSAFRATWGSVRAFINAFAIGCSFLGLGILTDRFGSTVAFLGVCVPVLAGCAVAAKHSWRE